MNSGMLKLYLCGNVNTGSFSLIDRACEREFTLDNLPDCYCICLYVSIAYDYQKDDIVEQITENNNYRTVWDLRETVIFKNTLQDYKCEEYIKYASSKLFYNARTGGNCSVDELICPCIIRNYTSSMDCAYSYMNLEKLTCDSEGRPEIYFATKKGMATKGAVTHRK